MEHFEIDRVGDRPGRAVAHADYRRAGVIRPEATDGERALLGRLILDEPGEPPLRDRLDPTGVSQRRPRPRRPAKHNRGDAVDGIFEDVLRDKERVRTAVENVIEPDPAVEEQEPVVADIDRRLDRVVAAGIARPADRGATLVAAPWPGGRRATQHLDIRPSQRVVDLGVGAGLLIEHPEEVVLFNVGEHLHRPGEMLADGLVSDRAVGIDDAGREVAGVELVVVEGEAELRRVVQAGAAPGGLAGGLDGREEEADERADDGDDDKQLDERERPQPAVGTVHGHGRASGVTAGDGSGTVDGGRAGS